MADPWYDSVSGTDSLGDESDIVEVFTEQAVAVEGGGVVRRNVMSAFPESHDFTILLSLQDPQGKHPHQCRLPTLKRPAYEQLQETTKIS